MSKQEQTVNNTESEDEEVPPNADLEAINIVISSGAVPFLDVAGTGRLRRHQEGENEVSWPIQSQRTRAWVAKVFYMQTNCLINKRALDRVLLLLDGLAEENDDIEVDLCDLIDIDPLLGVIVNYVKFQGYVKATAVDLLRNLNEFTRKDSVVRTVNWPQSPESLGVRLRKLIKWLEKAGIGTEFVRDSRNRWIILTDSYDGLSPKLSPTSISSPPHENKECNSSDAYDSHQAFDLEAQFREIQKGLAP